MTDGKTEARKSKPPVTHVLVITDASGSMWHRGADVREGFNGYLDELAGDDGRYRLTLTLFNSNAWTLCVDSKLKHVPRLNVDNYAPGGRTALLDAVGTTVHEFESRVTLARGERVLVVVQTDGHENASVEFSRDDVQALIRERTETNRWAFVYLGAGADAWGQGQALGMRDIAVTPGQRGVRSSYRAMSVGTVAYAAGSDIGETYAVVENAIDADGARGDDSTGKSVD